MQAGDTLLWRKQYGAIFLRTSEPGNRPLEERAGSERAAVAITFWATNGPLSFADCYHLALANLLGMTEIYTFDRKMDRYRGVACIGP